MASQPGEESADRSADEDPITVEVVHISEHRQFLKKLQVPYGSSLMTAIELAGVLKEFPELDLTKTKLGIYGKPADKEDVLNDLDRVEIYRPLLLDPRQARRQRAKRG